MKLLITGATGFLGYRTIEYLLAESDFHIIAAARTKRPERHFKSKRVKYHFGDLANEDYVKELFVSSPEMIVNCASLSSPWGKKYLFIRRIKKWMKPLQKGFIDFIRFQCLRISFL